jgi:RNA polymerase sigma-70 factor (ECF subfamily)
MAYPLAAMPSSSALPPAPSLDGLLAAAARGDQQAFASFYDQTSSQAFGLALRILRDRALAEETTLQAYTQLWQQADRHDPRRSNAVAWLLLVVRSRALDAVRSKGERVRRDSSSDPLPELVDSQPDPHQASELRERSQRVRCALGQLPREQREAIEAAFFDGLTHVEAAARLGAPLGTVKSRIRLGMTALRTLLAPVQGGIA